MRLDTSTPASVAARLPAGVPPTPSIPSHARWSTVALAGGALAALLALFELARIPTGGHLIQQPGATPIMMPLWAGAEHLLVGFSLIALCTIGHRRWVRAAVAVLAGLLLVASLLVLALGAREPFPASALSFLGQTRSVGAATGALVSLSLLCTLTPRAHTAANVLAMIVAGLGAAFVLGFLYGGPLVANAEWPALNLAAAVAAIGEGIAIVTLNGAAAWPMRLFHGTTVSAMLLRWFLPFVALTVLLTDVMTINVFRAFSPAVGSLVNTIASLAVASVLTLSIGRIIDSRIERSRAALIASEEAVRRSMRDLRALSTRLNGVREQERGRIAREVHDHLGQALTVLKMDLAELQRRARRGDLAAVTSRVAEMTDLVDAAIDDVRRVATELRPPLLDELGFIDALRAYLAEICRRTGVRCTLAEQTGTIEIGPERAIALFRILQEALTNVSRHAGAHAVEVRVSRQGRSVRLEIADDGRGLPPGEEANPRALGLTGMRDRAMLFGGTVTFSSGPTGGTTVTAVIPVDDAEAAP